MNSIVGSSWKRPRRSGLAPIRSPALTTKRVLGFVEPQRLQVRGEVLRAAGRNPAVPVTGSDDRARPVGGLEMAVEVVERRAAAARSSAQAASGSSAHWPVRPVATASASAAAASKNTVLLMSVPCPLPVVHDCFSASARAISVAASASVRLLPRCSSTIAMKPSRRSLRLLIFPLPSSCSACLSLSQSRRATFFSRRVLLRELADVRVRGPQRQPNELRIVVGDLVDELRVHVQDVVARRGCGVGQQIAADHDVVERLAVAVEDVAVALRRRQCLDQRRQACVLQLLHRCENWKSFRSPITATFAVGSSARMSSTKSASSVACWFRCTSVVSTGGCEGRREAGRRPSS